MATYGEGDPTDNAQDFYDWLQENDDEDLSGLNYTVSFLCSTFFQYKVFQIKSDCMGIVLLKVIHKKLRSNKHDTGFVSLPNQTKRVPL